MHVLSHQSKLNNYINGCLIGCSDYKSSEATLNW